MAAAAKMLRDGGGVFVGERPQGDFQLADQFGFRVHHGANGAKAGLLALRSELVPQLCRRDTEGK